MKILTFDIEEWFHLLDNPSTRFETQWTSFSSRIDQNVDRILEILDETDISATFFCLGWVAEKYPHIIRKISDLGYEIACHSHTHQLAYNQSPKEFREDLKRAKLCTEDVIGCEINTFRIPGFSLTKDNLWVFDIIREQGFSVDCSIFPASRSHGGFKNFITDQPCLIELKNSTLIKEFPLNTSSVLGNRLVFSGGGYFRLLPYPIIKHLFEQSKYVMTYFHPRDFDESQPIIENLSLIRRFKSYYGLKHAQEKLVKLINEFDFIDVRTAIQNIDWQTVDKINVSSLQS